MALSSKPDPGTVYFEAGSQQHTADLIAAQQGARANASVAEPIKGWVPWLICGAMLGGVVWYLRSTAD